MKFFAKYKYSFVVVILLLAMYFLSSTYALRPNIHKLFFIVIPISCIVSGIMGIWRIYRSYSLPLKARNWIVLIIYSIIIGVLIFFGTGLSSISSKAEGIFTTYRHTYKFNSITFYSYETGLMGTRTNIRYSEKNELISHSIDDISFSCGADSVHIELKDTSFLMVSPIQKYIFLPKSKKLIMLPY